MMLDNMPGAPLLVTAKGAVYREARFFYQKTGRAKYISHLDVTRCMQRAVKRAGLSLWYTEGFNPHVYMTFALPLPLGYESLCEVMDVRLTEDIPFEEAALRLDKALPPDIPVLRAASPVLKPSEITAALYRVEIGSERADGSAWEPAFLSLLDGGAIEVEKHTKKGPKKVDIRPDCELLSLETLEHGLRLELKMSAGTEHNINPTLLTDEFLRRLGCSDGYTRTVRKAILTADGRAFE